MVKVPATAEGLPAIEHLTGKGLNINITLLFSQKVYVEVAEAYLAGLERLVANGGDPSHVASVASFFVSRIDGAVDRQLDEKIARANDPHEKERLAALKGTASGKLSGQLSQLNVTITKISTDAKGLNSNPAGAITKLTADLSKLQSTAGPVIAEINAACPK